MKLPLLPQAKVNKCLIALVSCKAVKKTSVGVGSRLSSYRIFIEILSGCIKLRNQCVILGFLSVNLHYHPSKVDLAICCYTTWKYLRESAASYSSPPHFFLWLQLIDPNFVACFIPYIPVSLRCIYLKCINLSVSTKYLLLIILG